ncbi:MAG: DUF2577 domain-containing protein [Candidatus Fimivivens sp.]
MGFITVEQCKTIIKNYLSASGRGGFLTGVVTSVSPLCIMLEGRLPLTAKNLYVTDNCIGLTIDLKHKHGGGLEALAEPVTLRAPLAVGNGVLLMCRPGASGQQYILLDRIQPYSNVREVVADAAANNPA